MSAITERRVKHFDREVFAGEHPKKGWWKAADSSAAVHHDSAADPDRAAQSRADAARDIAAAAARSRTGALLLGVNRFAPDYELKLAILRRDAQLGPDLADDSEVARDLMIQHMRLDSREGQDAGPVSHFDEDKEYDADAARARMIARMHADSRDPNTGTNKSNIVERIGELGITRPAPLRGAIAHELRKG